MRMVVGLMMRRGTAKREGRQRQAGRGRALICTQGLHFVFWRRPAVVFLFPFHVCVCVQAAGSSRRGVSRARRTQQQLWRKKAGSWGFWFSAREGRRLLCTVYGWRFLEGEFKRVTHGTPQQRRGIGRFTHHRPRAPRWSYRFTFNKKSFSGGTRGAASAARLRVGVVLFTGRWGGGGCRRRR